MKACIIQPDYKFDMQYADECFEGLLALFDKCDESMDVIVAPEYCDTPVALKSREEFDACIERYNERILNKARDTAIRCGAVVFVNAAYKTDVDYRNTTHVFDKTGKIVGRYYKAHPAPSEFKSLEEGGRGLDTEYAQEYSEPYTVEIDGVRYGFMTCYDFYFYESFAPLARKNIDIIIGASHQRSDTHEALRIINKFLCYNTNAYLLRASVSLGADSPLGGCSMIVSPKGEILVDMVNDVGIRTYEINPKDKYYKPAGFGGKTKSHWEYIEAGRRPQNYRHGGSSVVRSEKDTPYPRVCSLGGLSAAAPAYSMPAIGAAVALGAEEIGLKLSLTKDNILLVTPSRSLEEISNASGMTDDFTYDELSRIDFGSQFSADYAGLKLPRFQDALQKFACRTILNIEIDDTTPIKSEFIISEVKRLLAKYDCEKHAYITSGSHRILSLSEKHAPDIVRCLKIDSLTDEALDFAIENGVKKLAISSKKVDLNTVEKIKKHGIVPMVFDIENENDARKYTEIGVMAFLTNNILSVTKAIRK